MARIPLRITKSDLRSADGRGPGPVGSNPVMEIAVANALRRVVRPGFDVSISIQRGSVTAQFGDHAFDLGRDLLAWLAEVLMTEDVVPATFRIELPLDVLRPATAAAAGTPVYR